MGVLWALFTSQIEVLTVKFDIFIESQVTLLLSRLLIPQIIFPIWCVVSDKSFVLALLRRAVGDVCLCLCVFFFMNPDGIGVNLRSNQGLSGSPWVHTIWEYIGCHFTMHICTFGFMYVCVSLLPLSHSLAGCYVFLCLIYPMQRSIVFNT